MSREVVDPDTGEVAPARSTQLARDAMPAKNGAVRRLRERVDELEKRIAALESADGRTRGLSGER